MSNTLTTMVRNEHTCRCKTYPLCVRVGHGLYQPIELIAHGLRGHASSSALEVLLCSKYTTDREYNAVLKNRSKAGKDEKRTMLDTPLVRGERVGLAGVGALRLDMVRNKVDAK